MGRGTSARSGQRDAGSRDLKEDASKNSRELKGRLKVAKGGRRKRSNRKEEVLEESV